MKLRSRARRPARGLRRFSFRQAFPPRQWLVLQGEADAGDPAAPLSLILANVTYERQGQRVVAQSAAQVGEVSGGKVKYRVEVESPRNAGRYQVELSQSNGKPESNRVIAQGELRVK